MASPERSTSMNKRQIGGEYETLAANYLVKKGYRILEKNFRCKIGEIDIIVYKQHTVVFVEVKYRKTGGSGYGFEAVPFYKQKKICRTADYYCMKNDLWDNLSYRFDIISIDGDDITHLENAFDYIPVRR